MALGDPFSTIYEGSRGGLGTLGESILGIAGLYAKRKQQERELALEEATKGRLLEKEYQLKQQYPDPFSRMLMLQYPQLFNLKEAGRIGEKDTLPLQNSEEVKKEFITQNPKYTESDIVAEPLYSTFKGAKIQTGWTPKVNEKAYEGRIKNEEISGLVKDSAQDVLNTIGEVEKGINYFGLTGQLPSIPGTARANWEANVNKLLSGKVLDVMTKMKQASKTGATGFGQLSNKELGVLQQASTAIKRGLSPKDAQRYINDMKANLQKVIEGQQEIPSFNSEQEAEASGIKGVILINGHRARID